ncbi:DNA/RNA non-specific endonuclease [Poriferisphaera corsica]|uniref:DNA/RNA non-specific endonuclease n=1 Tax=Poriferisphaera corsica TaxID=2528020 RepID=UPI00190B8AA9|nr:DNA/RNA non-specific endonuclease [Poriferisphaera corsica]
MNQDRDGITEEVIKKQVDWGDGSFDQGLEYPHVVFGEPGYRGHLEGVTRVRKYHGFSVYYDGRALGSRWTGIKLTAEMVDRGGEISRKGWRFKKDSWLEKQGYQVSQHKDYNNEKGKRVWDRGHMVSFDDSRGWGEASARDSFYTSNVWPQLGVLNQRAWLRLEEVCTEYARDYGVVWVLTGPVFEGEGKTIGRAFLSGRKVWGPDGFYKVLVRGSKDGGIEVLAFYLPQKGSNVSGIDLQRYVVSIDEVEAMTGLDFLHEIEDSLEELIESERGVMWADIKGRGKGF